MNHENLLSVEIFRDKYTPSVSIDPVFMALQGLQKFTGDIRVLGDDKKFQLTESRIPQLDKDNLPGPAQEADLNIIITERPFSTSTAGQSIIQRDGSLLGKRYSVVSTYDNYPHESTVRHEIAHLLNLKVMGERQDDSRHCTDKACTMYHTAEVEPRETLLRRLKKKMTRSEANEDIESSSDEFCHECREELAIHAFMLIRAKTAHDVPEHLIFPIHFNLGPQLRTIFNNTPSTARGADVEATE